jgi:type VI protein secretion system component VasK
LATARRVYFDAFDRILFRQTFASLGQQLAGLNSTAVSADLYSGEFNALQAYLVATAYPDSSSESLATAFMAAWQGGRQPTDSIKNLAMAQFIHYAGSLPRYNPYPSLRADSTSVRTAQAFLRQFKNGEPVYNAMVNDANRAIKPVIFDRDFVNAIVADAYPVPGAYTRDGWARMQRQFDRIANYADAAQWVTGDKGMSKADQDSLKTRVKLLYTRDYVRHWKTFLASARVGVGGTISEAGPRIQTLAGANSPLLRLMAVASQNTNVDTANIGVLFRAAQTVVPPNAPGGGLLQPSNQQYVNALVALGSSLTTGTDVKAASDAATNVTVAARQLALTGDPSVADAVRRALEAPAAAIASIQKGSQQVAGDAANFCDNYKALANRFPIGNDTPDVSIKEFNDVFAPGGSAARLQERLAASVTRQGRQFVRRTDAPLPVSSRFLSFLGGLARVREALYAAGRSDPTVTFTVRAEAPKTVTQMQMQMDGQSPGVWSGASTPTQTFVWHGNDARRATLLLVYESRFDESYPPGGRLGGSPWAILHLFKEGEHTRDANSDTFGWQVRAGMAQFHVETGREFISREIFAGLQTCPALVDQ